ncbi:MAG: hypothetical protein AAF529_04100 [Pseudomonadota bacterium]
MFTQQQQYVACAVCALVVLSALYALPKFEQRLESKARHTLQSFSWAEVRVVGPTIYLSGTADGGELAFAARKLRGVSPVARVVVQPSQRDAQLAGGH